MAKAVFTTKVDPTYDDLPEQRYHFPRTYLRQVEAAIGDGIIYYEPRRSSGHSSSRGGRLAYFATAIVTKVIPDPTRSDHFYAFVADYLDFDRAVPFNDGGRYYESALQRADGETNKGAFGRAVRAISDLEYEAILGAGFTRMFGDDPGSLAPSNASRLGIAEEPATFERPIIERVIARPLFDQWLKQDRIQFETVLRFVELCIGCSIVVSCL
jgi:putative restriction endonuclease